MGSITAATGTAISGNAIAVGTTSAAAGGASTSITGDTHKLAAAWAVAALVFRSPLLTTTALERALAAYQDTPGRLREA